MRTVSVPGLALFTTLSIMFQRLLVECVAVKLFGSGFELR